MSTTIWESASRPLFIRTVWLESNDLKRRFQRRYLLDYSPKNRDLIPAKTINVKQKMSAEKIGKN